jgi:hypothetical protein
MPAGLCDTCFVEAPLQRIQYHKNVGFLVGRQKTSLDADLCKDCVKEQLKSYTMVNLIGGWWSARSFVVTPVYLVTNFRQFRKTKDLAPVPRSAQKPRLDERTLARLQPLRDQIRKQIDVEPRLTIARWAAEESGLTLGETLLYVSTMAGQ